MIPARTIDARDIPEMSQKDILMEIWNELGKIASSLNKMAKVMQKEELSK